MAPSSPAAPPASDLPATMLSAARASLASVRPGPGPGLPPVCVGLHPSELIPGRPAERSASEACARAVQLSQATAGTTPRWTPLTPRVPPPFGTYNFQLAYDGADGYVLLFGASEVPGPHNGTETWAYRAGAWHQVHPPASPESCVGSVMAYDSFDGYVLLLEGANLAANVRCPNAGETWSFVHGNWTRQHPTSAPAPRQGAALTNDSGDGYMLLFGGLARGRPAFQSDTWSYLAGNWTRLNVTGPSARSGAGLAYDAADGYALLFGGSSFRWCTPKVPMQYCMDNDTWSFHSGTWTQLSPPGAVPPEPSDDGLVYDAADGVVLYTVADDNGTWGDPEIYWTFHAGVWTGYDSLAGWNCGVTIPCSRLGEGLAYDASDGYAVLFGGTDIAWQGMTDTWTYSGGNWTNRTVPTPSARGGASFAYDPAMHGVVLFGGMAPSAWGSLLPMSDTWLYNRTGWQSLSPKTSPSPRWSAAMTYDASDGYLLLFGGYSGYYPPLLQVHSDTWKFQNGTWTNLSGPVRPAARYNASMAYDPVDRYTVLFGGYGPKGWLNDTWTFSNGTWSNLRPAIHPTARMGAGVAFDVRDGYLVLFGGENASTFLGDTWKFVKGLWAALAPGGTPPGRSSAAVAYDPTFHRVVLFGGLNASGDLGDLWTFAGGNWTVARLAHAPAARFAAGLAELPSARSLILFGGFGTAGPIGQGGSDRLA